LSARADAPQLLGRLIKQDMGEVLLVAWEWRHEAPIADVEYWVISGASGAAAKLGMKRSTLQARMQKLGIQIARTSANRS
jgi:formate hydrogenlyase transcriptional activator